jgi:lysophospholipid acyltransferase (LPLAT)-like uncharacterized protein
MPAADDYDGLSGAVAKMITYKAVDCLFVPVNPLKVYEYSSLGQYSFGRRLAIRAAGMAFYLLIKLIGSTVRSETRGSQYLDAVRAAGRLPIYAVWHDRIFLGTYFLRRSRAVFLTSQSFDGEYIARFLQRFGYGAIRGSSTRGGRRGLVEMIRGMRQGLEMGFTVDGPKGPRHRVKPGVLLLAKKTGNPIVPFTVAAEHFWTVNSWDKLQIPRPFTRARLIYGKPIDVKAYSDEMTLDEKLVELQAALDELTALAENWQN